MNKTNGVMRQYFHWYLPSDCSLLKRNTEQASSLADFTVNSRSVRCGQIFDLINLF